VSRWADDYMTPDERRNAWFTEVAIRHERVQEQAAQRHSGPPAGHHDNPPVYGLPADHWPGGLGDGALTGVVVDKSVIDALGDQVVDQYTAYEAKQAEYAEREQEEARAWLTSHRPVNRGSW
jgi:hypothetical protein